MCQSLHSRQPRALVLVAPVLVSVCCLQPFYLILTLTYISLMINDAEHFFLCSFGEVSVQITGLFFNWVVFFLSLRLVYIFWIQML